MRNTDAPAVVPSRILYTMVRVTDLNRSIAFYRDTLGMHELRRETFSDARFTLVFIGYGDETSNAVLELTYNWDQGAYSHGTGYGHVALEVIDIYGACERLTSLGVKVTRAPGPMKVAPDETGERETIAFIEDPDGYRIELIENNRA
ncbi:lactoylglutathione lyase [Kiloniella antarctica]|uniref:lactoylglutathione lyase n=1 Tax=Kiloniella antarctica TaxID=1550907 RepID=A0ABW5BKA8_9PROT